MKNFTMMLAGLLTPLCPCAQNGFPERWQRMLEGVLSAWPISLSPTPEGDAGRRVDYSNNNFVGMDRGIDHTRLVVDTGKKIKWEATNNRSEHCDYHRKTSEKNIHRRRSRKPHLR
jgi:hypothetical protein